MDNKDKIMFVLSILVIIMAFVILKPIYDNSVADKVVVQVAQQQTQTGDIFIINNDALQVIPIQQICNGGVG